MTDFNEVTPQELSYATAEATSKDVGKETEIHHESIRTRRPEADSTKGKQRTLQDIIAPKSQHRQSGGVNGFLTSNTDVDVDRRKRRRISREGSIEVGASEDVALDSDLSGPVPEVEERASPLVMIPSPPQHGASTVQSQNVTLSHEAVAPQTPPKKLLRLNAAGKFSSPPSKSVKSTDGEASNPPTKRRGRPRKSNVREDRPPKHLIVKIVYGRDAAHRADVGERIFRILGGDDRLMDRQQNLSTKRTPKKPKQPTHPFFLGKAKVGAEAAPVRRESPRKASAVTPGKLRTQNGRDQQQAGNDASVGFVSELLKDRLMIRVAGASEAPFPAREQVHVRATTVDETDIARAAYSENRQSPRRKRKEASLPFTTNESVVAHCFERSLQVDEQTLRSDGFYEPPASVHVPERALLPSQTILERVVQELSNSPDGGGDVQRTRSRQPLHHQLERIAKLVATTMSAFDESRGEPLTWAQKYAPSAADEVLQIQKEPLVLRDWLKRLTVQAVSGAVIMQEKVKGPKTSEKPNKRRKKRHDDLDDFLVDDDEEMRDMSVLVTGHDMTDGNAQVQKSQKSIVEVVHDGTKLSNVVLLSGPNGCGKTASAYAVAAELGFRVFEINPGERRSGKDILDKVGNMTENHLVKHHGSEADVPVMEDPSFIDDDFQRDLQSGRQGKLNAFFKPRLPNKPKAGKPALTKARETPHEAPKRPAKDQQQSLILLEEVDILFRDDKDFWTTVLKLIVTSKRPCIMTCNDEDLVPLQAMSLHAILRFEHPPTELAADYMLLLAAAEGHLLRRDAIVSLYESHSHDLRASITALQYWCQMGIGDPRGGLSWIFQRWPPGSDLDDQQRPLRVTSCETYRAGIGALPACDTDMETSLAWLWDHFDIQPDMAFGWTDISADSDTPEELLSAKQKQQMLEDSYSFVEALSAADVFCSAALTAPLDPTQPELPERARPNYVESLALLQTDKSLDHLDTSRRLYVSTTVTAYKIYRASSYENNMDLLGSISRSQCPNDPNGLTRRDLTCFDAISVPAENSLASGPGLSLSAFDGTMTNITLDLAPYVRSIVQYDQALEEQRQRLDLLTSDGHRTKRARTTRAARSALEGGQRSMMRRERWFTKDLDTAAVLATGGERWPRSFAAPYGDVGAEGSEGTDAVASSAEGD